MADGGDDGAVAAGEALDGAGLAPTADDGVNVLGPGSDQAQPSAGGNGWFKQLVYAFIDAFKEIPVPPTLSMLVVSPRAETAGGPQPTHPPQNANPNKILSNNPSPKTAAHPQHPFPLALVAPRRRPSYAQVYSCFLACAGELCAQAAAAASILVSLCFFVSPGAKPSSNPAAVADLPCPPPPPTDRHPPSESVRRHRPSRPL